MSEQSRARAEDALRQHMENQPVRADWLTEAALNHCCVECDRHWPCPTVLLARDVLAGLEREKELEQRVAAQDGLIPNLKERDRLGEKARAAYQEERQLRESAERERDSLRVKLEGLVEAAQALVVRMDEATPYINSACSISGIHGMPYKGPTYGDALNALRAALEKAKEEGK